MTTTAPAASPAAAAATRPAAGGGRKICIFLMNLAGGGAERMMLNLAAAMVARGHAVDLVLTRLGGDHIVNLPPGVHLVDLDCTRTLASIPRFARYLRRARPDVVLSGLVHVNIAAIIATWLAGGRNRLVVSERNTISVDYHSDPALAIRVAHWLVPWLYPRADAITAVSQGVADDLAEFGRLPLASITTINNPVVTQELRDRAEQPLDDPWFAPGAPPVILAVGRLAPQKDFATLLDAFAMVAKQRDVRLIILGEGPERQALESQAAALGIAERLRLPGFAANPYAYMRQAALLVLSSRWEGSPNVLVEAMACGTPVVSTDCPSGPRETLDGGRLGPLVAMGDAPALARAIAETLDNPPAAETLRGRAADFSVEHSVDSYLRVMLP